MPVLLVFRKRIEVEGLEAVVLEDGLCEGRSCLVYAIHLYPLILCRWQKNRDRVVQTDVGNESVMIFPYAC